MLRLRSLFAREHGHVVDGGKVGCALRGHDVELDVCAGCRWLASIDEEEGVPVVRCDPDLVRVLPWPLH